MDTITCHVKTIREDLYLLSLSDSVFYESKGIQLEFKENEASLLTFTLDYRGNGTKKLEIELSEFSVLKKNHSAIMGLVPTITVIINGQSKVMTQQKIFNSSPLKWKCEIINMMEITAKYHQNLLANKSDHPSATTQSPFNINILIDFLCSDKVSRNVIVHIIEGESCCSNFSMEDHTLLPDVTFRVMGQTIRAHSTTLAAKSPVFSRMSQQNPVENFFEIEDMTSAVFRQFLQYLYTGKASGIETEEERLDGLLFAAEKYEVESLKEDCSFILAIKKSIAVDNVVQTLIVADRLSLSRVMRKALVYLSNHGKEVCARPEWKQLFKTHHELCFRATQAVMGLDFVDGQAKTNFEDKLKVKFSLRCSIILLFVFY